MSVPYNNEAREAYVARHAEKHLTVAGMHYALGHDHAMWIQLFTWGLCEEIYGEHWDKIQKEHNA